MPVKKKEERITKDSAPSPSERSAALKDWVNTKMKGRAQLQKASEYILPFLTKRFPTGLLTLDVALGGGFPCGGISQIVGPRSSGKTWIAWQVVRQLQQFFGDKTRVLLAMTEARADRSQARVSGVRISLGNEDIESLERGRTAHGLPKFTKEELNELRSETGVIDELHGASAEDLYDVVLRAVDENMYHLIIIDSIGIIMSGAEAEAETLSDKTYGGASAPNTQFLKKLCNMLTMDNAYGEVRDTCILAINQIRDNIKDQNKEYKSPGGKALEHAKFVDLFVSSGSQIAEEIAVYTAVGTKKQWVQSGKEVNWKIEKGKAGIHEGAKGKYLYTFKDGVDFYNDTIVAGVQHGVIEISGTWLGVPNPNEKDSFLLRSQGREKFIEALKKDALEKAEKGDTNSLMNYIHQEVFKKLDIHIDYSFGKGA